MVKENDALRPQISFMLINRLGQEKRFVLKSNRISSGTQFLKFLLEAKLKSGDLWQVINKGIIKTLIIRLPFVGFVSR